MKPDTMRRIDYYIGSPLCFFGTVLMAVKRIFFRRRSKTPRNVLFIELSEMGSAILANPAMEKVISEECNIFFLIFKSNVKSIFLLNTVPTGNIFTIRDHSMITLIIDTFKFLIWVRKTKIDSVLDLELFSRYTALLNGFSGASNRIGFYKFYNEGLYRGRMLTKNVAFNPHIHISKNFLSLVHALFTEKMEFPFSKIIVDDNDIKLPQLKFSQSDQNKIWKKIRDHSSVTSKKVVIINPNASDLLPQRRWPQSHFKDLILTIINEFPDILVLLTGAKSEFDRIERLENSINHNNCINFAGQLSLMELLILYSISELMVTNDSGPAHFASITKIPTFIIFGPETPKLYGALGNATYIYSGLNCSPCVSAWNHRKTSCKDNVCLQIIEFSRVMSLIRPILLKSIKK